MSEQNAVQSVDIMMEIFNLVVSKWVYYYRELGEISMVQSSVDAIDTHLDVLKHQEYPLENAVSKSFEALVYGETMNFDYMRVANKYAAKKNGEELVAFALALKYEGKSIKDVSFEDLKNDIDLLKGKEIKLIKQFVVDALSNQKYLQETFGNEFAKLVVDGEISGDALIGLVQLNSKEQMKLVEEVLNNINSADLNGFLMDKLVPYGLVIDPNHLIDFRTRSFLNDFSENLGINFNKFDSLEKVSGLRNDRKFANFMQDKMDDLYNHLDTANFENYYKFDEFGNQRTLEERKVAMATIQRICKMNGDQLSPQDISIIGFARYAKLKGGVIDINGRILTDKTVANFLHKLEKVKHGNLYSKTFRTNFSVKEDVNGKIITEGMLTDEARKNPYENKDLADLGHVIAQHLFRVEKEIIETEKAKGNFSELRGFDLSDSLFNTISKKNEDYEYNYDLFKQKLDSVNAGVDGIDLAKMLVGFRDVNTKEVVCPMDIVFEDYGSRVEMLSEAFEYVGPDYDGREFMRAVWAIDPSELDVPERTKQNFIDDRYNATLHRLNQIMRATNISQQERAEWFGEFIVDAWNDNRTKEPLSSILIGGALDLKINYGDTFIEEELRDRNIDFGKMTQAEIESYTTKFYELHENYSNYDESVRFDFKSMEREERE